MTRLVRILIALTATLLAVAPSELSFAQQNSSTPATAAAPHVWIGPEGQPLPFATDNELLEFLRTAKMKSMKSISRGITGPKKVLLEKNGIRANAHFNYVDEEKPNIVMADGTREVFFRDSFKFQGAAYELSRLLGLDSVPPAVERHLGGDAGSVSIWIEGAITEGERRKTGQKPPDPQRWMQQLEVMHVFDNLIYNIDRNVGNLLVDAQWKIWMIDHTRAFRPQEDLNAPQTIHQCERGLWQKLRGLDEQQVRLRLKPYLRGYEVDAVLKRRAKLVAYLEELIRTHGEEAVLFDWP